MKLANPGPKPDKAGPVAASAARLPRVPVCCLRVLVGCRERRCCLRVLVGCVRVLAGCPSSTGRHPGRRELVSMACLRRAMRGLPSERGTGRMGRPRCGGADPGGRGRGLGPRYDIAVSFP
jgi:hypothetical protein